MAMWLKARSRSMIITISSAFKYSSNHSIFSDHHANSCYTTLLVAKTAASGIFRDKSSAVIPSAFRRWESDTAGKQFAEAVAAYTHHEDDDDDDDDDEEKQEVVFKASRSANDHWQSILLTSLAVGSSLNHLWKPPPVGWLKINSDSSFKNGKAQAGCILRNSNGYILLASSHSHDCIDALVAETLAILDACKLLAQMKINEAILETDSLNAIKFINSASNTSFWTADPVIEKIKKFWNSWPKWRFNFAPRNANRSAHALASWASLVSWDGIIPLNSIPLKCFCDSGFPIVDSFDRFIN